MKKFALKPAVLLASVLALAAFAVPATASAVAWGPVGTTQSLDSFNHATNIPSFESGWKCEKEHLGLKVRNPASSIIDITAASYTNCSGTGSFFGCTVTQTPTGLPWTAQAGSLSNIVINVPKVNVVFSGPSCFWNGTATSYSGTLTGGFWTAASHSLSHINAPGLTLATIGFGYPPMAMTLSGASKDPAGALTLS